MSPTGSMFFNGLASPPIVGGLGGWMSPGGVGMLSPLAGTTPGMGLRGPNTPAGAGGPEDGGDPSYFDMVPINNTNNTSNVNNDANIDRPGDSGFFSPGIQFLSRVNSRGQSEIGSGLQSPVFDDSLNKVPSYNEVYDNDDDHTELVLMVLIINKNLSYPISNLLII
ncbi:unnamed protein product [Ambrosiozyma monospora]|uniref:Unnamed protein product n=1 Tax=Ambrosiozyma monospora TaxID=43982 RepID=A0ACB5UD48_AMBMO|nr:unnamed protein product [Ambrosiozyma monospora]